MTISRIGTWTIASIICAMILASCQKGEIEPTQVNSKNLITNKEVMNGEFTTDLIAGQYLDVGDVSVYDDGMNIFVTYTLHEPGWGLQQTHLHLATSLAGIPQTAKGNPKIGLFDYQMEHGMTQSYTYVIPLTWNPGTELHIAAHAAVGFDYLAAVTCVLPSTANLFLSTPHPPSSYECIVQEGGIINGSHDGWCIDRGNAIYPNQQTPYDVDVYNSYGDLSLIQNVDHPENLDKVNWLLNQDYVGQQSNCCGAFTVSDVQETIWILIDDDAMIGAGNPFRVEELINNVYLYGRNFVPGCDENIGIVLEPDDMAQVSLFMMPLADLVDGCENEQETAWGAGLPFPGNSWATYFLYTTSQ